jgi:hypothetical protein
MHARGAVELTAVGIRGVFEFSADARRVVRDTIDISREPARVWLS